MAVCPRGERVGLPPPRFFHAGKKIFTHNEQNHKQDDAQSDAALDELELRFVHGLVFHLLYFFMKLHVVLLFCHDRSP